MNWTEASLIVDSQEQRIRELEAERDEAVTQMVEAKGDRDNAAARIREQRDLLDECEQALADIQDYSSRPVITAIAKDTLAKLRAAQRTQMTEETHEAPKIEVIEYTEMEDGSAVVVVNISMEAARIILQTGFLKLLEDHIKESEESV